MPEASIQIAPCPDGVEMGCITPEAIWALDRWLGALRRWVDLASACPGVVVGPSGVTEELDKLKKSDGHR